LNAFVVLFQHGIELVHDAERRAKVAKKPKTVLSKLKAATTKVIQMQRFNWNEDLLRQSSLAGPQDLLTLSTQMLQKKEIEGKSDLVPEEFKKRTAQIALSITTVLFRYIERGVFAQDQLTLATLLCFSVADTSGGLNSTQLACLLTPPKAAEPSEMPDDTATWLPGRIWTQLKGLEDWALGNFGMEEFLDLADQVSSNQDKWHAWYRHPEPETQRLPGNLKDISRFSFLLVLRAMRLDRIPAALRTHVGEQLGRSFSSPPPFSMLDAYMESSASTPIFFVLFPGVDPTPWVESLGVRFDVCAENGTLSNISMGQGQETPAEATLDRMARLGGWIMLQNIQLMVSWLPRLERKLELASETAAINFRCFLNAEPPPLPYLCNIPESLLQTCIKVANEAPADLKSNLKRALTCFSQEQLDMCNHAAKFRQCLFGLCFFHAVVLGRRRFGQQGWSRPYGFNTGDLKICANVLARYMDRAPEGSDGRGISIPWADLRYIFGEIMYGGHITDFWDRRTNVSYLKAIFNENMLHPGAELAPGFSVPVGTLDHQGYESYVNNSLPRETPILFGLHPNAEVGYLTSTAESILETIAGLRRGTTTIVPNFNAGESGGSIREVLDSLEERLPTGFNLVLSQEKAKPLLGGPSAPYVVVALQEITQMNFLVGEIARSLSELRKGVNGQLNMSQRMEDLAAALSLNQVPGRNLFHLTSWERLAWPSRKNLQDWFFDLEKRVEQLATWEVNMELPKALWLALFNPTAFLTAIKQVVARMKSLPLDSMTVETNVTVYQTPQDLDSSVEKTPVDGAFTYGLYMQGARWMSIEEASAEGLLKDVSGIDCAGAIIDSRPKELLPRMPVLYIKAILVETNWEPTSIGYLRPGPGIYNCPCYNTSFRGHTYLFLATLDTQMPALKWVLAGVALLLSTDEHV